MSTLFAYSASVQLNDHDWYFWFPLYSRFWSLDLSERVVREKIGSILVVISTILQLKAASNVQKDISNIVKYGMLILVIFSYMLPFIFFVILKEK
ncbi:hypothetical protein P8452_76663 [Trifolium repens]|nr:hypothetical protein P8452_76663 [Trifolium repens]